MRLKTKKDSRTRRHVRLRQKIAGTPARPRMSVMVSGKHMYVQFIDDMAGRTMAAVSTLGAEPKHTKNNVSTAGALGKRAAEAAKAKGIDSVVFDRGGFAFHGRVKAIADAARQAGLRF